MAGRGRYRFLDRITCWSSSWRAAAGYVLWIRAIKHGMPWEEALRREFGATPASLADALVRWHLVND
ncbi:MAG: hypothetical protein KF817_03860 [Phycisphaeraceae bacterium]|nr:hypothetical protein [Phycisphaeraceae bacterium]